MTVFDSLHTDVLDTGAAMGQGFQVVISCWGDIPVSARAAAAGSAGSQLPAAAVSVLAPRPGLWILRELVLLHN